MEIELGHLPFDGASTKAKQPKLQTASPPNIPGAVYHGELFRRQTELVTNRVPQMRIYIPVTLTMLQQLVTDGSLLPASGTAFAVTPRLREAYAEGDDDELGEVALREAALASLRLLAAADEPAGGTLPPRRAVLVADVGEVTLRPDLDDAVVRIGGPVAIDEVIAAFVDNAAAEDDVTAAIAVIDEADLGDEDAELTVGDAQDHDLAWYAAQELPFLLELL